MMEEENRKAGELHRAYCRVFDGPDGREVLEDLRQAATNTDLSTGDEWVLSGAKLTSALQRYKEGVLEEILGPEVTQSLRQLADVAKGTSLAERGFANTSRSGAANATVLNDLLDFFRGRPMRATGSILGRFFAERGAGKVLGSEGGKRYLLGQLPWQAGNETVFGAIGRLGGQSAVRGTVAGVKDRR